MSSFGLLPATITHMGISPTNIKHSQQDTQFLNSSNVQDSNPPRDKFFFDTSRISISILSQEPPNSTIEKLPSIKVKPSLKQQESTKIIDLQQKLEESKSSFMQNGVFISRNTQMLEKEISLKRV
jgi:hypothetical protein